MPSRDSLLDIARSSRKILVFGAGGGGDALGAFIIYRILEDLDADVTLGSVVWERFNIDPFPGPIPLEMVAGAEVLGWTSGLVKGDEIAIRYGTSIKPQVVRLAEKLGKQLVYIDLSKGAEGVRLALEDIHRELGIEIFIGVDTGGDILARGCEENLWSPLADAMSLYALSRAPGESYVVVLSPGADGELDWSLVLKYIAEIAESHGLIEVFGINRRIHREALKVAEAVISEASRIPIRAFSGEYGSTYIRGGTRRVDLTPCQATSYLLDALKVAERSKMPELVAGTRGVGYASQALNEACIVTELDLEMELSRLRETGSRRPMSIDQIRRSLREALMRRGCRPITCS